MLGVLATKPPDVISTAVMGSVLECQDRGFHFLGGMVPDVDRGVPEAYDDSDVSVVIRMSRVRLVVEAKSTDVPWSETVLAHEPSALASDLEVGTLAAGAVRHFTELMGRGRDGMMRYLSRAGMAKEEEASLVALVDRWLDEAGLERLGVLSRMAVEGQLGPGHVLETWINGRSKLDLALLLDDTHIRNWELAVAYAFAHASEMVLASYWSDGVPSSGVLSLVPGNDLD